MSQLIPELVDVSDHAAGGINSAIDENLECSIHQWYHKYEKQTIKSVSIPLPERFVSYLQEDGIVLPEDIDRSAIGTDQLSDDEGIFHNESDDQNSSLAPAPFVALNNQIRTAMASLGGQVFIKLNDKSAIDAGWINNGSMKCESMSSVYLLLKASDRMGSALDNVSESFLTIRKWANLHPSMEFRCFVFENKLRGEK